MNVEYLLSFKNDPKFKELDQEYLKQFSLILKNSKKKKKSQKFSENKKTISILKNEKIQNLKDRLDNKFSLIINKLDFENTEPIIREFINKFKNISFSEFCLFQKCIFFRMLKDKKFQEIYLYFYLKIKQIYDNLYDTQDRFFINLMETKFKIDYEELEISDDFIKNNSEIKKLNIANVLIDYKLLEDFKKSKEEESRINNLNLILKLVQKKYLSNNILDEICDKLVETNYIPDIYHFFSNKYVYNNIDLSKYMKILEFKIDELKKSNYSNRYLVLLERIIEVTENSSVLCLDCNDPNNLNSIYESDKLMNSNDDESITDFEEDQLKSFEEKIEDSCKKSEFEVEIENILDEYLLLEDVEEVSTFIKTCHEESNETSNMKIKEFIFQLINFYFKNNLNNYDKFKILFLSFRNISAVKPEIIKNSLIEIIKSDNSFDYVNLSLKLSKLIEIFKILKIKFSEDEKNQLTH